MTPEERAAKWQASCARFQKRYLKEQHHAQILFNENTELKEKVKHAFYAVSEIKNKLDHYHNDHSEISISDLQADVRDLLKVLEDTE